MTAPIVPETILGEMQKVWISLGKEQGQSGLLRSCTMTLIVVTDEPEGTSLEQTLAELMQSHPSRTIVLRRVEGEARLDAGVRAQCWRPFGSRQQICCELITVSFTAEHMDGAVNLLRGLLVADLPVVLWLRVAESAMGQEFDSLRRMASRVIVDSSRAADAAEGIAVVRRLAEAGVAVSDLAWTRLSPWRKMTADLFDAFECRKRLETVSEIVVTYRGDAVTPSALYLGAWLKGGFPAAPAVTYRAAEPGCQGDYPQGSIQSVVMRAADFEIVLKVTGTTPDTRQIELRAGALVSHLVLPVSGETSLLDEELRITGADRHFVRALRGRP